MSNDLVSVIIPTYNRAYCIRETLNSVLAQTHANWEAVVVDDGSTDDTAELIAREYGHDERIRYLYQENAGVSHARNTGIAQSHGAYVAFLDSDDTWKEWKLEAQLGCLRAFPDLGMVWTDMEAVNGAGQITDPRHLKTMYSAYRFLDLEVLFDRAIPLDEIAQCPPAHGAKLYMGDIYGDMIRGNLVHTSTVMLTRDRLDKVKFFDEALKSSGEDYDFHLRTCKWGRVGLMDLASIRYQKGHADHLSIDSYSTAINFLSTIEQAVLDDADARRFSPRRVRQALAEAHGWVAEENFQKRRSSAVRKHAYRSLRLQPFQPRLAVLLAAACIPGFVVCGLLDAYRNLKKQNRGVRHAIG